MVPLQLLFLLMGGSAADVRHTCTKFQTHSKERMSAMACRFGPSGWAPILGGCLLPPADLRYGRVRISLRSLIQLACSRQCHTPPSSKLRLPQGRWQLDPREAPWMYSSGQPRRSTFFMLGPADVSGQPRELLDQNLLVVVPNGGAAACVPGF